VNHFNFITKNISFCAVSQANKKKSGRSVGQFAPEVAPDVQNAGHEVVPGVQIWYVVHGANSNSPETDLVLTKADFEEFAAIRHADVRRRSLSARAVLRRALSEMVDGRTAPEGWRFERTETGQPKLAAKQNALQFSCSHTSRISIVAVSTVGDVGIDIADATFESAVNWLEDVMAPGEQTALARLPETKRDGAIARLWTLKEAYVKMLGIGIAEVAQAAFDLSDDRLLSGGSNGTRAKPVFRTWIVNSQGHRYSVALALSCFESPRASFKRCQSEGSLVDPRSKLAILAKRARERASSFASVFRAASSAQA
jgi:4'-phosphopantetheinyl transferase